MRLIAEWREYRGLAVFSARWSRNDYTITNVPLVTGGEYFVRVTSFPAHVQLYQLDLSLVAAISGLPGDYNVDGMVNDGDYLVWTDNFGSMVPGTVSEELVTAIPEPPSLTILVVSGLLFLKSFKPRR